MIWQSMKGAGLFSGSKSTFMRALKGVVASLVTGLISALLFSFPVNAQGWQRYQNERFGTSALVPSDFIAEPAPANGDGRTFRPSMGPGMIRVYGAMNSLSDTLNGYRSDIVGYYFQDGLELTYSPQGRNWFVLSGYIGNEIVYFRAEHGTGCSAELIHHIEYRYPAADKRIWDPIVSQGAKSLDGPCF